jgi:hypothetical protein
VRMNDTHGLFPDPADPQISQILLDHPEWVIRRDDGVPERALDYSFARVRAHRLAILKELAEGYDIDGIELDFTRWAKFFARNQAPAKASLMTQFVGDVRQMLDEVAQARGRPRFLLGVQVLESIHLNLLAGLQPADWVAEGWIDYLIQCDFNCTNPQLPVDEFAEVCADTRCTHHVRMGNMMAAGWSAKPHMKGRSTAAYKNNQSYGGMVLQLDEACGAAANIYGFGADGVGLWNICCNLGGQHKVDSTGPDRGRFQQDMLDWITAVDDPEGVWNSPRTYHFVPINKSATLPVRNYPVNALLTSPTGWPVQIVHFSAKSQGFRLTYRFRCADGERWGEDSTGEMRWRILGCGPADQFSFDLNGTALDVTSAEEADDELPAMWFATQLTGASPLKGISELGMTFLGRADGAKGDPYMEELLVMISGDRA